MSRLVEHEVANINTAPETNVTNGLHRAGESVVVPTGPANQAIDGRFFFARLVLDVSDGLRLDQFTIEEASP